MSKKRKNLLLLRSGHRVLIPNWDASGSPKMFASQNGQMDLIWFNEAYFRFVFLEYLQDFTGNLNKNPQIFGSILSKPRFPRHPFTSSEIIMATRPKASKYGTRCISWLMQLMQHKVGDVFSMIMKY